METFAASLLLISCVTLDETATSLCLRVLSCKMGIQKTSHTPVHLRARGAGAPSCGGSPSVYQAVGCRETPTLSRARLRGRLCGTTHHAPGRPGTPPIRADRGAGGNSSKVSAHSVCSCAGQPRDSSDLGDSASPLPRRAALGALPSLPLSVWALCSNPRALLSLHRSDKKAESSFFG